MLAANADPIEVMMNKARQIVLQAWQEGWTGPPYDQFRLANYLGVDVIPSSDVFDARTVSVGSSRFQIQYDPDKPPNGSVSLYLTKSPTRFSRTARRYGIAFKPTKLGMMIGSWNYFVTLLSLSF